MPRYYMIPKKENSFDAFMDLSLMIKDKGHRSHLSLRLPLIILDTENPLSKKELEEFMKQMKEKLKEILEGEWEIRVYPH